MVELTFVNVNHPVQLRNPKYRRQIRSHISRVQNEQKRSAIDQAVGKLRLDAHDLDGNAFDITRHEDDGDIAVGQPNGAAVSTARARPINDREDILHTTTTTATAKNPSHPRHRAPIPSSSSIVHIPQDETQYVRNAPIRAPPVSPGIHHRLTDTTDELQIFARHAEMSAPSMLCHARDIISLVDTAPEPQHSLPKGYIWALWERSLRLEPSVRAAVVLGAAASIRPHQANPVNLELLYRLRGHALCCIRAALEDPERRSSDAMLVAVTSIAVCELYLAPKEVHDAHMRGLAQIMQIRGPVLDPGLVEAISCIAGLKITELMHLNDVYCA